MTGQRKTAPRMIVFAGPNGSGKSTFTDAIRHDESFPGDYINADDIARTELSHIEDTDKRNLEAARIADQRRQDALDSGRSFAFETVMSTPGKLVWLQEAKGKGFEVEFVFVTTRDADINIGRVSERVAQGGHAVDPGKVRERYDRAMLLLPSAIDLVDKANVYDNSTEEIQCVAMKRDGVLTLVNTDKAPPWVREFLARPYRERRESRARLEAAFREAAIGTQALLEDARTSHGAAYAGLIVDATKHHALQKTTPDSYVLHDRALYPRPLKKGQTATVAYRYRNGKIMNSLNEAESGF